MALVLRVVWCVASELKNVKLIYMCVGKERGEVCTCGRRLFSIRKLSHLRKVPRYQVNRRYFSLGSDRSVLREN